MSEQSGSSNQSAICEKNSHFDNNNDSKEKTSDHSKLASTSVVTALYSRATPGELIPPIKDTSQGHHRVDNAQKKSESDQLLPYFPFPELVRMKSPSTFHQFTIKIYVGLSGYTLKLLHTYKTGETGVYDRLMQKIREKIKTDKKFELNYFRNYGRRDNVTNDAELVAAMVIHGVIQENTNPNLSMLILLLSFDEESENDGECEVVHAMASRLFNVDEDDEDIDAPSIAVNRDFLNIRKTVLPDFVVQKGVRTAEVAELLAVYGLESLKELCKPRSVTPEDTPSLMCSSTSPANKSGPQTDGEVKIIRVDRGRQIPSSGFGEVKNSNQNKSEAEKISTQAKKLKKQTIAPKPNSQVSSDYAIMEKKVIMEALGEQKNMDYASDSSGRTASSLSFHEPASKKKNSLPSDGAPARRYTNNFDMNLALSSPNMDGLSFVPSENAKDLAKVVKKVNDSEAKVAADTDSKPSAEPTISKSQKKKLKAKAKKAAAEAEAKAAMT